MVYRMAGLFSDGELVPSYEAQAEDEGNTSVEPHSSSLAHVKRGAILVNPEKPYRGYWNSSPYMWVSSEQSPCLFPL